MDGAAGHDRPAARRASLAWLVSALVHALIAGALLYVATRPEPPAPAPPPPIEIEITSDGEARAVPAPPPLPPRDVTVSPLPSRFAPEAPRRRAGGSAPDDGRIAGRAGSAGQTEANPRTAAPGDGATRPGPAADRGPLDLSLGALSRETRSRLVGPEPDAELRAKPPRRPSLDEIRAEREREEDAVANVEKGRVDPVFYDYLRGARTRVETEARRLAEAIKLGPRESVEGWKRGYLQRVREAMRQMRDAERDADAPRSGNEAPATDLLAAYNESARQAEHGAEVRRAEVCLDVDPGKAIVPSLRRGSGNAALDRLAVDSFVRAIAARPLPDGLRSGLACYEISISAYRMPPVPMFACNLDVTDFHCAWPFKRITKVTAHLLSVDYSRSERTASRSLLRRAR